VLLAGVLSPLLCPPFGIANISLRSLLFWANDASTLLVWWLGEMASVLVLTPLLVIWGTRERLGWTLGRAAEFAGLLALLIGVGVPVFSSLSPTWAQSCLLPCFCMPFPLWAALRFGPGTTTLVTAALALVALWGTLRGYGVFAWAVPDKALLACQSFVAFYSVLGLVVVAVVRQREEAQPALDDLGLAPALQRYIQEWSSRSGIPVDFSDFAPQSTRLPARIETVLYRVTQEALTNVLRHAKAHRASVPSGASGWSLSSELSGVIQEPARPIWKSASGWSISGQTAE
jgi:hypothetical protein